MGVFSGNGIGVDLGSGYTTISLGGRSIALREPTCALVNRANSTEVLALGRDAQRMLGRTDEEAILVSPVAGGGVADTELASRLLVHLIEKAMDKRRAFDRERIAITVPHGATRVERAALAGAIGLSGAKRALMVKSCAAAAIGAELHPEKPRGTLIISVGAAVTEIAILSLNGVVGSRTLRTGSAAFDEAIVRYVRRVKGLVIGMSTAEELKMDIGSATRPEDLHEVLLRGRHVVSGKPSTESVSSDDIYQALNEPVRAIVEGICDALYNVPPELTGDILDSGIQLTGGGALLVGLADRLRQETQLPINVSEHPQDDAALGAARIAQDDRLARQLINAYSAYEV